MLVSSSYSSSLLSLSLYPVLRLAFPEQRLQSGSGEQSLPDPRQARTRARAGDLVTTETDRDRGSSAAGGGGSSHSLPLFHAFRLSSCLSLFSRFLSFLCIPLSPFFQQCTLLSACPKCLMWKSLASCFFLLCWFVIWCLLLGLLFFFFACW